VDKGQERPRLEVDWTRCKGHGLCAQLVPELIHPDRNGYPVFLDTPVPFWLEREAQQAVEMCPSLALRLTKPSASPAKPAAPSVRSGRIMLELPAGTQG